MPPGRNAAWRRLLSAHASLLGWLCVCAVSLLRADHSGALAAALPPLPQAAPGVDLGAAPASQAHERPDNMPLVNHTTNMELDLRHAAMIQATPHFLIIGVQKCGTSALYYSICEHPQVQCSAYSKEPFYLSAHSTSQLPRDADGNITLQARQHYHNAYVNTVFNISATKPGKLNTEASTSYFDSMTALHAISEGLMNSDTIRLLVLLREPISRAYSHWQHESRRGRDVPRTFADAVREELSIMTFCREQDVALFMSKTSAENRPKEKYLYEKFYDCIAEQETLLRNKGKRLMRFLFKGLYYAALQPWLERFPGRVSVLLYDNLRRDPVSILDVVQEFLGLEHFDYGQILEKIAHEYQEGSRYERLGGLLVQQLAQEFAVHNDLLSHFLGVDVGWNRRLHEAHYIIPI